MFHRTYCGYGEHGLVRRDNKKIGKMDMGEVELKKDVEWEGDEKKWCVAEHGAWTEKDEIDLQMRQLKLSEKVHI